MIGLLDYRAGNRKSVENALRHLDLEYRIVERPEQLRSVDRIIFPGVGEARAAMDVLKERRLDEGIRKSIESGMPFLGICIGCQVMLESSEERDTACLGVIRGTSKRFPRNAGIKIPQIGWNQVNHRNRHSLFRGIPDGACFYFVHSYYPAPEDRELEIADTEYGISFTSAFAFENLAAVQFHAEKSGKWGLKLLSNFAESEGW